MMDGKTRLKHVERLTEINKLRNVASCWFYSANILADNEASSSFTLTAQYTYVPHSLTLLFPSTVCICVRLYCRFTR